VLGVCLIFGVGAGRAEPQPRELVAQTADKMMAKLKEEKEVIKQQPDKVYDLVNEIVLPNFDFELMAKRVLGKYWRTATDKQRAEFIGAFRGVLVRTYANRLTEYTEYKINYLPSRPDPEPDKATVRSEIDQPGRTPVAVDYRLILNGQTWKVFDVAIEGVSLVTNYRSSYANEIDRSGLDSLIEKLNKKAEVAQK
jgi:phospholipid transport system substrate-binding protein